MSMKYRLSFGENFFETDGTVGTQMLNIVGNEKVNVTLVSIKYCKAIYQPGYIEAVLESSLTVTEVSEYVKDKSVSLTADDNVIASGYHVFEIIPKYIVGEARQIMLKIYSPDKYLTLNQYCQVYVGNKLKGKILTEKLKSLSALTVPFDSDVANLQFLTYSRSGHTLEYIHPYLVQYNESFYDFLARTANRCGEFLYYENGKLHLGLPGGGQTKTLTDTDYKSVSYCSFSKTASVPKDWHRNYRESKLYTTESLVYDFEGPQEESLASVKEKQEEVDMLKPKNIIKWTTSALNEPTLSEMLTSIATNTVLDSLKEWRKVANKNDKFNETHITEVTESSVKTTFKDSSNKEVIVYDQVSDDKKEVTKFSSYRGKDETNINLSFFEGIYRNELTAREKTIHVKMKVGKASDCLLGNVVQLNCLGNQTPYVITKIEGFFKKDTNWEEGLEIEVVPEIKEGETWKPYPPLMADGIARKSGPQVAFVDDTNDPEGWGRVCIRYPWQQKEKKHSCSPWIRVSVPMATGGKSGFNFEPVAGDEVLVDYENGNIERPYVVGFLYSSYHKPGSSRAITSVNGHTIKFDDSSDGTNFLTQMFPGVQLVKSFIPSFKAKWDTKLAGGIELTDSYGLYSVKMSSDSRSISLSSPLGDISMNAFSGITISAPNGDIRIKGKNVSIEAGNKLSLVSGKNVSNGFARLGKLGEGWFKSDSDKWGQIGEGVLKGVAGKTVGKFFDLSLIRTIIETFLRPVGGTMSIKSHRYMLLSAGKAKGQVPNKFYGKEKSERLDRRMVVLRATKKTISLAQAFLKSSLQKYEDSYKVLSPKSVAYQKAYNAAKASAEKIPSLDEIVEKAINNGALADDDFKDKNKVLESKHVTDARKNGKELLDAIKTANTNLNGFWDNSNTDNLYLANSWSALDGVGDELIKNMQDALKAMKTDLQGNGKYSSFGTDANLLEDNKNITEDGIYFRQGYVALIKKMVEEDVLVTLKECEDYSKDKEWNKYINSIRVKEEVKGLTKAGDFFTGTSKVTNYILDKSGFKGFLDDHVWQPVQSGEILFSDKDGKQTLYFDEQNHLSSFANEDLSSIVKLLKDK